MLLFFIIENVIMNFKVEKLALPIIINVDTYVVEQNVYF